MADLGSINDLKDSIDDKIYDNNAFDVSAEDIRSSFEDTIDTLDALKEGAYAVAAYVDGVNGSDTTGEIGTDNPFLTINEATQQSYNYLQTNGIDEARALVIVKKGTYRESSICRSNVDMDFEMGAVVIGSTGGTPVINDFTHPLNITITGKGSFYHTAYNPSNDQQAIATSNASTTNFSFQGYEVDGIQNFGSTGQTFNYFDVRIRFTVDHHNNQTLNFNNCTFLSGFSSGHFLGNNVSVSITNSEIILPSDDFTSLVDIKDYTGAVVDTIVLGALFTPVDTSSMTRAQIRDYVPNQIISNPQIAGIHHVSDNTPGASFNNNYRLSISNSIVRVRKENCIGINVTQNIDVDDSVDDRGYIMIKDVHIEDETTSRDITGVVTGQKTGLAETLQLGLEYFANATTKKDIIQATGLEGGNDGRSYIELPEVYSSPETQNLQEVLDQGSTADSTTDVEIKRNTSSLVVEGDGNATEPKINMWRNKGNLDSSGDVISLGLDFFGNLEYRRYSGFAGNTLGNGGIDFDGHSLFRIEATNDTGDFLFEQQKDNISIQGLTASNESYNSFVGNTGFLLNSKSSTGEITLQSFSDSEGVVITNQSLNTETPGATLDVDGDLRVRQANLTFGIEYTLALSADNTVVKEFKRREIIEESNSVLGESPNKYLGHTVYGLNTSAPLIKANQPYDGNDNDPYFLKIKDNGSSQSLSWETSGIGVIFKGTFVSLPLSTVPGKWMTIEFRWNGQDNLWDCYDIKNEL